MTTSISRLLIVTGMSGAGRSTCLKILEDLDFEAVDNLPLPLLQRLLASEETIERDLAIGMDTRTRDFAPQAIVDLIAKINAKGSMSADLIFCDCADRVIQQRYSESRRPHPLAPDRRVADGIAFERTLLKPLRDQAEFVLDTTETSPRSLADRLGTIFAKSASKTLAISVMSFAFRHGLPRDADLVFDVRFLRNPHYIPDLRHATGLEGRVAEHIRTDPDFQNYTASLLNLLLPLLPRYLAEGKTYLTIAFGCTGGQHRSVFLAEWLSSGLSERGWAAKTFHREIENNRLSTASQL